MEVWKSGWVEEWKAGKVQGLKVVEWKHGGAEM